MASDRRLLNLCIILHILSIWYNTVVNSNPEWDNLDELPEFSTDELKIYGIELQDADSDALKELFNKIDSQQSTDEGSLQYMQAKLLQKWHIDANVENLTLITRRFIDNPREMTKKLMIMILGKETLQNMTPRKSKNVLYTLIPENVQNFVLEYVNSQAESGIDNSTFLKALQDLCNNLRFNNERKSRMKDSIMSATKETPSAFQVELLLQKFQIHVDINALFVIANKFHNNYNFMINPLLKMIIGERNLRNMYTRKNLERINIPTNVLNFVYEYLNLYTEPKIDKREFNKKVTNFCKYLRKIYSKDNSLVE